MSVMDLSGCLDTSHLVFMFQIIIIQCALFLQFTTIEEDTVTGKHTVSYRYQNQRQYGRHCQTTDTPSGRHISAPTP